MSVVYDTRRVTRWLDAQLGHDVPSPVHEAIGFERDGKLTAAVCFDGLYENSVNAHIISRGRIPVDLMVATGRYAYEQCGLDRITFMTPETNAQAVQLVKDMGAEFEGRMRRAMKEGDVLIYALWRNAPFSQRCLSRAERLQ